MIMSLKQRKMTFVPRINHNKYMGTLCQNNLDRTRFVSSYVVLGLHKKDVNEFSYLRRRVLGWNLSCKLPEHFTNLWQIYSFWALPKILHHRKWPLCLMAPGPASHSLVWPLCKPACQLCAKRNVPSTISSKFLYIFYRHHLNFETKMRFLCKEL